MHTKLKELQIGDQLSIDDKNVHALTHQEDFIIQSITVYSKEEGEVVLIAIADDTYLISHTLNGDPRCYVYELNYHGFIEDVEDEGIKVLDNDDQFKLRTKIKLGTESIACKTLNDPLYDVTVEVGRDADLAISVCEYKTSCKNYPFMFAEAIDDFINIYQGIRIQQTSIVI
jgi:hypothetical protein